MAILNLTPDSFGEAEPRVRRGEPVDAGAAVEAALAMEAQGADLIDIGGESTRPGADPVSVEDELARVLPTIRQLVPRVRVPISIDTYKADVARAALDVGASVVNDISGLRQDPRLAAVAAEWACPLILMHRRGSSKAMYAEAEYRDVVREVSDELRASMAVATQAGVPLGQIVVDPGIGFAKRPSHSYGVLAQLQEIGAALGRPLVVGVSRKSFMREVLARSTGPGARLGDGGRRHGRRAGRGSRRAGARRGRDGSGGEGG